MKRQLFTYLGSYPADSRFPFKPAVALAPLDSHCILSKHKAIFCSNSPCNSLTNSVQHFPLSIEFPLGILRGPRNHGRRKRDRNVERNDIGAQHTVFGAVREPMNEFTIRTPVDLRGTLREFTDVHRATCLTSTFRHWVGYLFARSTSSPISSRRWWLLPFERAREIHFGASTCSFHCFFFHRPLRVYSGDCDRSSLRMVPKAVFRDSTHQLGSHRRYALHAPSHRFSVYIWEVSSSPFL